MGVILLGAELGRGGIGANRMQFAARPSFLSSSHGPTVPSGQVQTSGRQATAIVAVSDWSSTPNRATKVSRLVREKPTGIAHLATLLDKALAYIHGARVGRAHGECRSMKVRSNVVAVGALAWMCLYPHCLSATDSHFMPLKLCGNLEAAKRQAQRDADLARYPFNDNTFSVPETGCQNLLASLLGNMRDFPELTIPEYVAWSVVYDENGPHFVNTTRPDGTEVVSIIVGYKKQKTRIYRVIFQMSSGNRFNGFVAISQMTVIESYYFAKGLPPP